MMMGGKEPIMIYRVPDFQKIQSPISRDIFKAFSDKDDIMPNPFVISVHGLKNPCFIALTDAL